jgi:SAM-dependent methyltransferase
MSPPELAEVLAAERRIMDGWAPHYDEAMLSNALVYKLERDAFADWILATLRSGEKDLAASSVLDVGCGTAYLLERLQRGGLGSVTGLDLSEAMLERAGARGLEDAAWVHGTLESTDFPSASFDLITACFTLHHLHDPASFFALVESSLRPGGWFFALEYSGSAAAIADQRSTLGRAAKRGGDLLRAAFTTKNRKALARRPVAERHFNPAHRFLSFDQIVSAIGRPGAYAIERIDRGVLLPTLIPVLVEDSRLDRGLARSLGAIDRQLAPRVGGLFQWVGGRRL